MSGDTGFIPWRDLVQLDGWNGQLGLVIEAFRDGYLVYLPGHGIEHAPFTLRLLGYDRLKGPLLDDEVARARRCYSFERSARTNPDLVSYVADLRGGWMNLLDEGLAGRYETIRTQVERAKLKDCSPESVVSPALFLVSK